MDTDRSRKESKNVIWTIEDDLNHKNPLKREKEEVIGSLSIQDIFSEGNRERIRAKVEENRRARAAK